MAERPKRSLEALLGVSSLKYAAVICANQTLHKWREMRDFSETPFGPFPVLDLLTLYPEVLPLIGPIDKEKAFVSNEAHGRLILVNVNQTPQAQRFSIAHEIGHLELWRLATRISGYSMSLPRPNSRYIDIRFNHGEKEGFCDIFAANILLPRTLVLQWATTVGSKLGSKEIEDGAKFFQVPVELFRNRLLSCCPAILRATALSGGV